MNSGYFIAKKLPDGTPGRPIGNEEDAISLFEDLDLAVKVRDSMLPEHGELSVFKINVAFVGEVLL
jgi:hypothetical protein